MTIVDDYGKAFSIANVEAFKEHPQNFIPLREKVTVVYTKKTDTGLTLQNLFTSI